MSWRFLQLPLIDLCLRLRLLHFRSAFETDLATGFMGTSTDPRKYVQ
jgi:hypothetical protein